MRKGSKKQNSVVSLISFIILVLVLTLGYDGTWAIDENGINFNFDYQENGVVDEDSDKIVIHFLDVGQGDSTFIELPNGDNMLIDASEKEYGEDIVSYIDNLGYSDIDYLVGTHPHSDHIGGMKEVVESFDIGTIYMPKVVSNTKTYENLLTVISNKGYKIKEAFEGVEIIDGYDLDITVLSPIKSEYNDLNNYSVVIKIEYLDKSFLFMGDAEKLVEEDLGNEVASDVIKVGHHGSDTSSSMDFVRKVSPDYAIISVGEGNSYNHPHSEVLDRYEKVGATIYRTDLDGTIKVISDGYNIEVVTER